jgi:hypothetical protein
MRYVEVTLARATTEAAVAVVMDFTLPGGSTQERLHCETFSAEIWDKVRDHADPDKYYYAPTGEVATHITNSSLTDPMKVHDFIKLGRLPDGTFEMVWWECIAQ